MEHGKPRKRLIFILGFMASGKSTISRLLAGRLGYDFIDTDTIIEEEESRTIPEIFEENGEAWFRDREHRLLKRIVDRSDCAVVATGGGMPCNEENFALMEKYGCTVYLKATPEDIFSRIRNTSTRPVFHHLSESLNPKEAVKSLLEQREAFYLRSDVQVWNRNRSPADTVDEIVRALAITERSGTKKTWKP